MNNKILKSNEIDATKITFSASKTNKYGGKLVYLNYNKGPLRVQTPKMSLPFGISKWETQPGSNAYKYLMEFSFSGMNDDPKMKKFYESLKEVEEKVKSQAEEQSISWFKKKQSREIIDEFFKSQLKHSLDEEGNDNGKYPPRIKTKLIKTDEGFKVDIYDSVKNENGEYEKLILDESNSEDIVPKGSKAVAILECTGIWFVEKTFGISWKVAQVKIFRSGNKISGFSIEDNEEDSEEEKEETQAMSELSISEEPSQENSEDVSKGDDQEDETKVVELPKKKSMKKK